MPNMKDWERLADWYDRKQGDAGDLWHRTLIDPTLLKVIGNCRGKDVLDLGCGNGYLSRRLARGGARVTAIDASPRMIRNAKARDPKGSLGIRYLRSDAGRLDRIPGSCFDLVFANMSLMDVENAEDAVREVGRVLKHGGRFVASISHPCFDVMSHSSWVAEKLTGKPPVVYRKITGYRRRFSEEIPWSLGARRKMYTRSFHRPLGWYARILRANGMAITALEEPEPTREFIEEEQKKPGDLDGAGFLEVPLHLVIEAVRL
jgi:ubiquinone/menaquinone biosynthesis C-methylase UbiE